MMDLIKITIGVVATFLITVLFLNCSKHVATKTDALIPGEASSVSTTTIESGPGNASEGSSIDNSEETPGSSSDNNSGSDSGNNSGDAAGELADNTDSKSCNEVLAKGNSTGDGLYQISSFVSDPYTVYCDMTREGGGWTLVALNNNPGGSSLRIELQRDIAPTWSHAINSITTTFDNNSLSSDLDSYKMLVGLVHWNVLGSQLKVQMGPSAQFLERMAISDFSLDPAADYQINFTGEILVGLGNTSPGLIEFHNGAAFSTRDRDNDTLNSQSNAGSCSIRYSNTPWWYKDCWNGSLWGGGSLNSEHTNAPYWGPAQGTTFYNHGSIWVK